MKLKLILISGGCGVGKRTIAQALSKCTNTPLVHNHLTTNIVTAIYGEEWFRESDTAPKKLLFKLRATILRSAVASRLPALIMTHANHESRGSEYLAWLDKLCLTLRVELKIINLTCAEDIRRKRFLCQERGVLAKPHDADTFDAISKHWGAPALVSYDLPVVATIDVAGTEPEVVATALKQYLAT